MKKILENSAVVKIVSMLLALLMWFIVIDNENPITTVELGVPLKIDHDTSLLERGLCIKDKDFPRTVSVAIKGRKDRVSTVTSDDIDASIDLADITDINVKLVSVKASTNKKGIMIESISPKTIGIKVEQLGQNVFPIEVVTVGTLKNGYKITRIEANPENLSIHDTDSVVKSIGKAKVLVDVSNLDRDVVIKNYCKVYNKNGAEISELGKKYNINVKVSIAKEVPIIPAIKGKPAKNCIEGPHTVSPANALIEGDGEILSKIFEIKTESIDIEDSNKDVTKVCSLNVPQGVRLVDTPSSVSVKVSIEPISIKEFTYKKADIKIMNTDDSLQKYEIIPSSVSIVIKGRSEEVNRLNEMELHPFINVASLGEGKHKVRLEVTLPPSIKVSQDQEVEIEISKK